MENQTPLESQQQVESIQQPLKIDAKQEKTLVNPPNKKKSPAIAILSILLIFALSVVGYFIYGFYSIYAEACLGARFEEVRRN